MFDRRGGRKYLDGAERRAFLRTAKRERDPVRRSFLLTLFYTGFRISEGLKVTKERVGANEGSITFETLKRRKAGHFRSVPIPEELMAIILRSGRAGNSTSRVWTFSRATGYRCVKACMARAGIGGAMASPKGLRHGFAVACLSERIPLPIVQKWLGHARMETTAIYLEVSGEEERELAALLWSATKKVRKSACSARKRK